MMTCDDLHARLSDLADGALPAAEEAELRAHLATCAACAGLLSDLVRVRDAARTLGPIAPPAHVWLEVAGRARLESPVEAAAPASASSGALRQWLSLAAALLVITIGAYAITRWTSAPEAPADAPQTAADAGTAGLEAVVDELGAALEKAIGELRTLAENADRPAESQVATALLANLQVIDQAIAESRLALAEDPTNEPARDSLFEALRRKVGVLQSTMVLINDMRLGNAEGAAQAAASLGKKS